MFDTPDSYVWDFWLADDGRDYHLFFLYASRALRDPDARHYRASIGHAVSPDLKNWTRVRDALVRSDAPAFDDLATWTGSVVRGDDGLWYLFYTGTTLRPEGDIQSIGYATSPDLMEWTKAGQVLTADDRWYEKLGGPWRDEGFRDPWVFRADDEWHMLVTARANHGEVDDRGVIGHATSSDLRTWTPRPPLSEPGQGFGHMEVLQTWRLDGQWVVLFSALSGQLAKTGPHAGSPGGVWAAKADSPLGPFDLANAQLILGRRHYVGRLIDDRETGQTMLLAFRNEDEDGRFVGGIIDPIPVRWETDRVKLG